MGTALAAPFQVPTRLGGSSARALVPGDRIRAAMPAVHASYTTLFTTSSSLGGLIVWFRPANFSCRAGLSTSGAEPLEYRT
jgi:hypothetical protein